MGERNHWQLLSVRDLCVTTTSGGTPSRKRPEYFVHRGIPWLKTQELSDCVLYDASEHISEVAVMESSAKLLPVGTVLVAMYGATAGQLGLLGRPMTCNQACCALIVDEAKADPRFLYYALLNDRLRLRSLANGAAQQNLNVGIISRFPILAPPLSEQRAIAAVLGALDDKIEANRRIEGRSRLLMDALFSCLQETALEAELPLMSVVEFVFGEPFDSDFFNGDKLGRPLIRIRDLKTFIPQFFSTECRSKETIVQPGEVLVGMDAEFRPTIWCGEPGLLNQRVCLARPRVGSLAFISKLLEAPLAEVESFKIGTTVSHLNKSDLEQIRVALPDTRNVAKFDRTAEPLRLQIVALHQENRCLTQLRDILLPRLLSGEIRVRGAEELLAARV